MNNQQKRIINASSELLSELEALQVFGGQMPEQDGTDDSNTYCPCVGSLCQQKGTICQQVKFSC